MRSPSCAPLVASWKDCKPANDTAAMLHELSALNRCAFSPTLVAVLRRVNERGPAGQTERGVGEVGAKREAGEWAVAGHSRRSDGGCCLGTGDRTYQCVALRWSAFSYSLRQSI